MMEKKFFGIFNRRERWGFSPRGWVVLIFGMMTLAIFFVLTVHSFLAITARVPAKTLVVEGWVHDYTIYAAAAEFTNGNYKQIFVTGGPVDGGRYINDFNTYAEVGAEALQKIGVPAIAVPAREVRRDRTYNSAAALHDYFREHQMNVESMDVLTEDAHARRSRLLFQKAFGPKVSVGIISVPDPDYDPRRWWKYSAGVREILGESIAWIYARIFFHPAAA